MGDNRVLTPQALGQEDLDTVRRFGAELRAKNRGYDGGMTNHAEVVQIVQRQAANLAGLLTAGVRLRIDFEDMEGGKAESMWLSQGSCAHTSRSDVRIFPWTSDYVRLRHCEIGDDEEVRVPVSKRYPDGVREVRVDRRHRFRSTRDWKDLSEWQVEGPGSHGPIPLLSKWLAGDAPADEPEIPAAAGIHRTASIPELGQFGHRALVLDVDRRQDEVTRFKPEKTVVIEGAPGTGKTTVALQRAAYLNLADRETFNWAAAFERERTGIFVRTAVLLRSMQEQLRELQFGLDRQVFAYEDWVRQQMSGRGIFRPAEQGFKRASSVLSVTCSQLRLTPLLLDALETFMLRDLVARWPEARAAAEREISGLGSLGVRASVLHLELKRSLDRLERRVVPGSSSSASVSDARVAWLRDLRDIENRFELGSEQRELLSGTDQMIFQMLADYPAMYRKFVESHYATGAWLSGAKQLGFGQRRSSKQLAMWREQIAIGEIDEVDEQLLALVVHVVTRSEGASDGSRGLRRLVPLPTFCHVIVDEAQDFTLAELRLLRDLAEPPHCCVTLAADLRQAIARSYSLRSWEDLDVRQNDLVRLRVPYRAVARLVALARRYYRANFHEPPPFDAQPDPGSTGDLQIVQEASPGRLAQSVATAIKELLSASPTARVVVLTETHKEAQSWTKRLGRQMENTFTKVVLGRGPMLADPGPVYVTELAEVKGMEFDAVFLVARNHGPGDGKEEKRLRANQHYVGITRARRFLGLVFEREVPGTFRFLPKSLVARRSTGRRRSVRTGRTK